jgi:hypothetical protein
LKVIKGPFQETRRNRGTPSEASPVVRKL